MPRNGERVAAGPGPDRRRRLGARSGHHEGRGRDRRRRLAAGDALDADLEGDLGPVARTPGTRRRRPGSHTIEVRATDGTGDVQTADRTPPAPDGARGHHTIQVQRRLTAGAGAARSAMPKPAAGYGTPVHDSSPLRLRPTRPLRRRHHRRARQPDVLPPGPRGRPGRQRSSSRRSRSRSSPSASASCSTSSSTRGIADRRPTTRRDDGARSTSRSTRPSGPTTLTLGWDGDAERILVEARGRGRGRRRGRAIDDRRRRRRRRRGRRGRDGHRPVRRSRAWPDRPRASCSPPSRASTTTTRTARTRSASGSPPTTARALRRTRAPGRRRGPPAVPAVRPAARSAGPHLPAPERPLRQLTPEPDARPPHRCRSTTPRALERPARRRDRDRRAAAGLVEPRDALPRPAAVPADPETPLVVEAVYKPTAGERPLDDFPDETLSRREVAAFLVSEAIGWGDRAADDPPRRPVRRRRRSSSGSTSTRPSTSSRWSSRTTARLRRIAVFDAAVNNTDRKGGHLLPIAGGHVYGVDHGVTFSTVPEAPDGALGLARPAVRGRRAGRAARGSPTALRGDLARDLAGLLSRAEIAATRRRVDAAARDAAGSRCPGPTGRRSPGRRSELVTGRAGEASTPGDGSRRTAVSRPRAADAAAGLDLDPAVGLLLGRMLDEGDQPARHEPAGPDRRPATGDLADLDDAAGGRDLEPPAVLRRRDLERLDRPGPGVDHDLDPIATHARTVAPPPDARPTRSSGCRTIRVRRWNGWIDEDAEPPRDPRRRAAACSRPRSGRARRRRTRALDDVVAGAPAVAARRTTDGARRSSRSIGSATPAARACPTGSRSGAAGSGASPTPSRGPPTTRPRSATCFELARGPRCRR